MTDKSIQEFKGGKPKITIEEVRKLYQKDMRKHEGYMDKFYIDFSDYCKELEILFEITY